MRPAPWRITLAISAACGARQIDQRWDLRRRSGAVVAMADGALREI